MESSLYVCRPIIQQSTNTSEPGTVHFRVSVQLIFGFKAPNKTALRKAFYDAEKKQIFISFHTKINSKPSGVLKIYSLARVRERSEPELVAQAKR